MEMKVAEPLGERQRRGKKTKRDLLEATKKLFVENDYHSITLDQVAKAVGVSKPTILWHFESKEGLLVAAILDMFEDFENAIVVEKSALPTLGERIMRILDAVADYYEDNPQAKGVVLSLIFNKQAPESVRHRITDHLLSDRRRLVEFLSSDDEPITENQAAAIAGMIHGCYIQWYTDGCPDDLRQRLHDTYSAFPL